MENFDFKKYLAESKLTENTLSKDIEDFKNSIEIDNYQRSKDNDPDFENVDFDMEFFLDMYPEYAGKEKEIQQILNNKGTSLNEAVSDFTFEELGMLRDGLDWIVEYQEGVAPDSYIADVKRLAMKLDGMALQK
jgi:hypothetical protein